MKHRLKTLLATSVLSATSTFGAGTADQEETLNNAQESREQTQVVSTMGSQTKSGIEELSIDTLCEIIGTTVKVGDSDINSITIRFCDYKTLLCLSLTSKRLSSVARIVINTMASHISNILPLLKEVSSLPQIDQSILRLYNYPTNINSFAQWMHVLLDPRLRIATISPELATNTKTAIAGLNSLSAKQKAVLSALFPHSTPDEMSSFIYLIDDYVDTIKQSAIDPLIYLKGVVAIYKQSRNPMNPKDIIDLAGALFSPRKVNAKRDAIELLKSIPKFCQTPTSAQIIDAATNIRLLVTGRFTTGFITKEETLQYCQDAADLYKLSVESKYKPSLENMIEAADGLRALGGANHALAAKLYLQVGTSETATLQNLVSAADGLRALGGDYHELAAKLYLQVGTSETATSQDIFAATNGLKVLGSKYYQIVADIFKLSVLNKKMNSNDDIKKTYSVLREIGQHKIANDIEKYLSSSQNVSSPVNTRMLDKKLIDS